LSTIQVEKIQTFLLQLETSGNLYHEQGAFSCPEYRFLGQISVYSLPIASDSLR